jgi:uncharacterized protein
VFVNPAPEELAERLRQARTIAVVGLSDKPYRDSFGVAEYLEATGYKVVPVNPHIRMWRGHQAFPDLESAKGAAARVGRKIDLVDVFRRPSEVRKVVKDIVRLKLPAAWFQLGVVDWEAAAWARDHGVWVVMDHCIAVEHRRLIAAR